MSPCTCFYCCVYSVLLNFLSVFWYYMGPRPIPPQVAGLAVTPPFGAKVSLCLIPCTSCGELAWATLSYLNLWAPHRGLSRYTRRLWAGNCCLRHPFSPVLEPRQGGDICSLAGLTWPQVIFSSNNVLLAVQAWGTPSAWRHVPRPPIRWVSSGRWVLSEPCQYIPCPLLPTISSRVFSARHNINLMVHILMLLWQHAQFQSFSL